MVRALFRRILGLDSLVEYEKSRKIRLLRFFCFIAILGQSAILLATGIITLLTAINGLVFVYVLVITPLFTGITLVSYNLGNSNRFRQGVWLLAGTEIVGLALTYLMVGMIFPLMLGYLLPIVMVCALLSFGEGLYIIGFCLLYTLVFYLAVEFFQIYTPPISVNGEGQILITLLADFLIVPMVITKVLVSSEVRVSNERKKAEEAQRFLAETSKLLSVSLDYEATLQNVARMAVPVLADWCGLYVMEGKDKTKRVAMAHCDPLKETSLEDLHLRYPFNPEISKTRLARAFYTAQKEVYSDVPDELLAANAQDKEHLRLMKEVGFSSYLAIPLLARGRVFGMALFVSAKPGFYKPGETGLVEELARRASLAIDNARLYREAQQAIAHKEESLALLNTLLEAAPIGISFFDKELRYVHINNFLASLNRKKPENFLGKTLAETLPERAQDVGPLMRSVLETGVPVLNREMSAAVYGEEKHWLGNYYPVRTSDGEILGVGATVIDITERKRAEEILQESEKKYRSVVENIKEAVFQTDSTGRFTFINPAWTEITGFTVEETVGTDFFSYIHPEDRHLNAELFQFLLEHRIEYCRPTARFRTREGRFRWVDVLANLTVGDDEASPGISGTLSDITERKQAELLEKDRNQVLEMVTGNAPLADILGQITAMVERQSHGMRCRIMPHPAVIIPAPLNALRRPGTQTLVLDPEGESALNVVDFEANLLPDTHHKLEGMWSMPVLSSKDAVLGTLAVYYYEPARNADNDLPLLEMARQLAAIAIEQRQLTNQLVYQAHHDNLTGLPNRISYEEHLQEALTEAHRNGHMVAVFFIDLDRFKLINDTLGHVIGDSLLQQVAWRLQTCFRKYDTVARRGGDEFAALLTDLENLEQAALVAQQCLAVFHEPFKVHETELFVTASIGISLYPEDGETAGELLRKADTAMYQAKEQGKNTYQFFVQEMKHAGLRRLMLENNLRKAQERGELVLYYHPQIELSTGKLTGLEALIRWNHPELGLISPAEFIPMAEESSLIIPIGEWVIREACRQMKIWVDEGFGDLKMAVNVSALQFEQLNFVSTVSQALQESGLPPATLELELAETLLLRDIKGTAHKLAQLKELGVSIAIDDFGTGYSSLSYLQQLPVDTLKIDRSFVIEIDETSLNMANGRAILKAIIMLGQSLGMKVVAEGVETTGQLEFLRKNDCDGMQGYLFTPPLPASRFEAILKSIQKNHQPLI